MSRSNSMPLASRAGSMVVQGASVSAQVAKRENAEDWRAIQKEASSRQAARNAGSLRSGASGRFCAASSNGRPWQSHPARQTTCDPLALSKRA